MKVFFNGNKDMVFDCSDPIEQRIYKSGKFAGWLLIFNISNSNITSDNVMDVIGNDKPEMTFVGEKENTLILSGYTTLLACTIRHRASGSVVELQFKKEPEEDIEGVTTDETNETTD